MDDLFRRANKYSMLEDDVRAAPNKFWLPEDHLEVTRREMLNLRTGQDRLTEGRKGQVARKAASHTLSISYEKLLPMIQGLSDFRVAKTQGTDPSTRDIARDILKEKSLPQHHNPGPREPPGPQRPKAVINYINGGPSDEEYDSRRKRQKLLRAASIRERINSIRPGLTGGGPRPIDGTIIFPPVDPTRTLQPHRDALILSLEIGDFDVRRILVDPGSSADLVQASVVSHMGHSLTGLKTLDESYPDSTVFNYVLGRHCTAGPSWPSHSQRTISVVQELSPFNIILGRTWLHYMKAIPSTYHQMVSFLTNEGKLTYMAASWPLANAIR
ncbi:hypothetical protein CK203_094013 [Vitis vinifera]|uniref:Uncharacterized protein n=1 Tax=Vitis vinifera TaxID=29760 RepID=A0A438BS41_VITVI|nr:hypothetical protein CK203_094013 [Vitis vinifera]